MVVVVVGGGGRRQRVRCGQAGGSLHAQLTVFALEHRQLDYTVALLLLQDGLDERQSWTPANKSSAHLAAV